MPLIPMKLHRVDRHVIFVVITLLVFLLYIAYKDLMSQIRTRSTKSAMGLILNLCQAYATAHDNTYPDGETSNEAFRKLFHVEPRNVSEGMFLRSSSSKRYPDEEIGGAENGFSKALEPGECDVYYVRAHPSATSHSVNPRVFVFVRADWKNYWVWSSYGAMTKDSLGSGSLLTRGVLNAEEVDLLSPDYWKQFGVDFKDVLAPEGFAPDVAALNSQARANRRVRWLIFIPYGLFLIADLGYVLYARRKLRESSAANS